MAFNAGEIVGKIKAEIADFQKGIATVKKETQSMTDTVKAKFGDMNKGLKDAEGELKKVSVAFAAIGAAGAYAMTTLAKASGEAAGISKAFTAFFGKDAPAALEKLKAATKGTVAEVDLMRQANQAMLLGIDPKILPQMFDGAMRSAQASGRPVAMAIEDITLGVGRQSKMILDNLGILVDVDGANQTYAASIGKTSDALTDQEKKIAFTNATMKALGENAARVGEVQENAAIKMQQATAAISNAFVKLGDAVAPIVAQVADWITGFADWFTNLNPIIQQAIGWVMALVTGFSLLAAPILGLIAMIPSVTAGFAVLSANAGAIGLALSGVLIPIAAVGAALTVLYYAWQTNFGNIQSIVTSAWETIKGIFWTAYDEVYAIVVQLWDAILVIWNASLEAIFGDTNLTWEQITAAITLFIQIITNTFIAFLQVTVFVFKSVLGIITGAVQFIAGVLTGNTDLIRAAAQSFFGAFGNVGITVVNSVIGVMEGFVNKAIDMVNKMLEQMRKIPGVAALLKGVSNLSHVQLGRLNESIASGGNGAFVMPTFGVADVGITTPSINGAGTGGAPTGSGGGSSKEKEKTAEEYVAEIDKTVSKNVSELMSQRSDLRSQKSALDSGIAKIDDELTRQKKEGTTSAITKQLQDKRAALIAERNGVVAKLTDVEKKLNRSDSAAGRDARDQMEVDTKNDAIKSNVGGIDDLIGAQREHEQALEEAKRKREKELAEKKKEAESKQQTTVSIGSAISAPTPTVATPAAATQTVADVISTGGDTYQGGMHFHAGAFEGTLISSKEYLKELFDEAFKDMQAKLGV